MRRGGYGKGGSLVQRRGGDKVWVAIEKRGIVPFSFKVLRIKLRGSKFKV